MMIRFNKPAYNDKRLKNEIPDLIECKEAVELIDEALRLSPFLNLDAVKRVQSLIYDYENLRHFRSRLVNNKLHDGTVIKFGENETD